MEEFELVGRGLGKGPNEAIKVRVNHTVALVAATQVIT